MDQSIASMSSRRPIPDGSVHEDELSPLLSPAVTGLSNYHSISPTDSHVKRTVRVQWTRVVLAGVVLLLLFVAFFTHLAVKSYPKAAQFTVNNADLSITNTGLLVDLEASLWFDYASIGGWLTSSSLAAVGWLTKHRVALTLDSVLQVGVYDGDGSKAVQVVEVVIPEDERCVEVELGEGETTKVSLKSIEILVDQHSLPDFLNKVLASRAIPAGSRMLCSTRVSVLGAPALAVSLEYALDRLNIGKILDKFESELRLTNVTVSGAEGGSELVGTALVRIPEVQEVGFAHIAGLPALHWSVGVHGCDGEWVRVLSAANKKVGRGNFGTGFDVEGEYVIPKLAPELLVPCGNNNITSANRILAAYLSGGATNVSVVGEIPQSSDVPDWLSGFVSRLNVQLQVGAVQLPLLDNVHDPVQNMSVDSVAVSVGKNGQLVLDASASILFNIPEQVELTAFNVTGIRGRIDLLDVDESVCRLRMKDWADSSFSNSSIRLVLDEGEVEFYDPVTVGRALNDLLDGEEVELKVRTGLDVGIESAFVNTTLENVEIEASSSVEIPGASNSSDLPLDLALNGIHFLDSSPEKLLLRVDVGVRNPLPISVQNELQWAGFQVDYVDTAIAQVGVQRFSLDASPETVSNVSLVLSLESDPMRGKGMLEELFGRYLSGQSPDVLVTGGPGRCVPESDMLSAVLQQIHYGLKVPQFKKVGNKDKGGESLFILDSTLHLMSSEIELTVFNPIVNQAIAVTIIEGKASHDDVTLGYISHEVKLVVPPGVYKTPRINITLASTGIGGDLLRKALNGELEVEAQALLGVTLGEFDLTVFYRGTTSKTKIRL